MICAALISLRYGSYATEALTRNQQQYFNFVKYDLI